MTETKQKSAGQTMYNLQSRRTLPRDVIKWLQGLDLSYSVKDYRKDLSNGFLFGQIISRYEPGRIPMHAFENSQNQIRRDNNWKQIQLFFSKYELQGSKIQSEEYFKIMKMTDFKSEQLYHFICQLYSICTKKNMPENPPIVDLPPTTMNNPNLTASYLLKDDGLEKISNELNNSSNQSQIKNQLSSKISADQDRVPTRKIAPNAENPNLVGVTSIGIRAEGRKMTSKKKTWNMDPKQQSNYSQQNDEDERFIFDYLRQILQECLPEEEDSQLHEILMPKNSHFKITELFIKNITTIKSAFICTFFTQVHRNINNLIPILLRQSHEIWKFFAYFLRMLRHFTLDSKQLQILTQLIIQYALNAHSREPGRIAAVFMDSLQEIIVSQVKVAESSWRKKQMIMAMVYNFMGRQINDKKKTLSKLKELIGSTHGLFIDWLAVLIREQRGQVPQNNTLIQDYIYYAHQNLSSTVISMRVASLKILHEIASNPGTYNLIQAYFIAHCQTYRQSYYDPQQSYLITAIYFNLIREIIRCRQYQTILKNSNSNALVKNYNPDNEKNMQQLKKRINVLSQTIYCIFGCSFDLDVRELIAKMATKFLFNSKFMMLIFLEEMSTHHNKPSLLTRETISYEFKTMKVVAQSVQFETLCDYSNQILVQIMELIDKKHVHLKDLLFLINHCLQNLNIKKINMEIWEDVAYKIAKPYISLLNSSSSNKEEVLNGIYNIFLIYFNFDIKIKQFNEWLIDCLDIVIREGNHQMIQEFEKWLNIQYEKGKNQLIKSTVQELQDLIQKKGHQKKLIKLHSL